MMTFKSEVNVLITLFKVSNLQFLIPNSYCPIIVFYKSFYLQNIIIHVSFTKKLNHSTKLFFVKFWVTAQRTLDNNH